MFYLDSPTDKNDDTQKNGVELKDELALLQVLIVPISLTVSHPM